MSFLNTDLHLFFYCFNRIHYDITLTNFKNTLADELSKLYSQVNVKPLQQDKKGIPEKKRGISEGIGCLSVFEGKSIG